MLSVTDLRQIDTAAADLSRRAARRRAEEHCSHAVMVDRYVARYQQLVGARVSA